MKNIISDIEKSSKIEYSLEAMLNEKKKGNYAQSLAILKRIKDSYLSIATPSDYTFYHIDGKHYSMNALEKELKKKAKTKEFFETLRQTVIMTLVGAVFIAMPIVMNDPGLFKGIFKGKPSCTEQKSSYVEYRMNNGDCPWKIVKQSYPNLSDAEIYRFIDEKVSPLNNRGRMADYSVKDSSKTNPHMWHAGETIKIPAYNSIDF